MVTYNGLRVLMMAEDDLRRILGLFRAVRASQPTKKSENKTPCVFFHCASDGNAPGRRNITQKSKNNEKLNSKKIEFLKIENIVRIDAPMYFLEAATSKTHPKYPKNLIFKNYDFYIKINYIEKGPLAPM